MATEILFTPHLQSSMPFGNMNDGNRIQMAASQARQILPLFQGEVPFVTTGFESLTLESYEAKFDGIVLYAHPKFILVKNIKTNEFDYLPLSIFDVPLVKTGEKVEKGQLLAGPEKFLNYDNTNGSQMLTYGLNLYVNIINHPLAYEDAYVISESTSRKFSSFYKEEFIKVLKDDEFLEPVYNNLYHPPIGIVVRKGEPIFIIRNTKLKKQVLTFDKDIIIDYIDIIPNPKIPQDLPGIFKGYLTAELAKRNEILDEIRKVTNNDERILFEISKILGLSGNDADLRKSWSCAIRMIYKNYQENIDIGDKITNRHAGKGVISLIEKDNNMNFNYPDNIRTDIILNPMSIISRMNIGTLYELFASRIAYHLNRTIKNKIESGEDLELIYNELLYFYDQIDKTEDKEILNNLRSLIDYIKQAFNIDEQRKIIKNIFWTYVAPSFYSTTIEEMLNLSHRYIPKQYALKSSLVNDEIQIEKYSKKVNKLNDKIMKQLNEIYDIENVDKDDVIELNDIISLTRLVKNGNYILSNSGFLYYVKLKHLAKEKLSARSVGKMSNKYLQPKKEKTETGKIPTGQRYGEMEVLALLSHGSINFTKNLLTIYSDDLQGKINSVVNLLFGTSNVHTSSGKSAAIELINAYLKFFGIDISK